MENEHEIVKGINVVYGKGLCSNIYILRDGNRDLLIDTGNGKVLIDVDPEAVILTHGHFDHTGGVKDTWKAYLHEKDIIKAVAFKPPANVRKLDFNQLSFGRFELEIYHTPGHTLGSISIFERNNKILFTGDTLFAQGHEGRTDFGGDVGLLKKSLENIGRIPYTILCPGHDEIEERHV